MAFSAWQPRFVILKVATDRWPRAVSKPDHESDVSVVAIRPPTIFDVVNGDSSRVLSVTSTF